MGPVLKAFSVVGSGVLVLVSGAAAYAALQSCGLRFEILSGLSGCPTNDEIALQDELERLDLNRTILRTKIARLERKIAAQQCEAIPPSTTAPIDRASLETGDLSALYGCWSLGSTYQTRDVDTGLVISYPSWRMCFDLQGNGIQLMEGDDGSTCEGPVEARIDSPMQLVLGEAGNLACSDGGYIHRRDIACSAGAGESITCATLQPETEGQADVPFTRWQ